uniref:FRIGIDA-like protein n=1 Tax=Populus trichocarpa TaxID=3694 RepID=A0A2K1XXG9_POPTR|eukprot:XP_006375598.2 FRIGIDA-like protein 3 [Populus trichocarpa]
MEDSESVATLMDSTTSKIHQLQKAFAELESHRAVTLNLKWKELEEHFHGLERSLKRRFHELEDQEKQYETKTRRAREILEKREAAVVAKEQVSLEKLQDKRDAAIFSISNALQKHRKVSSVEPAVVSYDDQFGSPAIDDQPPEAMTAESNLGEIIDPSENGNLEYPQLVELCEQMDSEGLHKFISDNRKNLAVLKEEIPLALKAAANPAQFVLNSLEDFYPKEVSNVDGKKDSTLLGVRRTCIMLMECLSILLMYADLVSVSDVISEDVKDQAKAIAEEWKPRLDSLDVDANNGNSLEAHAFLQLLATFGIASDFDEEELSRLIPMVSRRRQAAELCRFLGLSEKMPGVIEVLVNSGRQIDAVNLAFAFDLTEQFSPVTLLKSYLKEARKVSSSVKPGNASPITGQNEVNERELAALKAVIKCIEEHKLEEQYPGDPLQKRLLQLEKAKAEKKRATEAAKPQPKRPRASGVGCGPRVTSSVPERTFYPRVPERYPQYVYDRPYIYTGPADNHVPQLMSSAATYNFSPSHGNYFGNGYQYQTPYHH